MLELVGEKDEKRMKLQVCIMSNFQFVKFIDRVLEDITSLETSVTTTGLRTPWEA
jgi:hypothetical protein